MEAQFMKDDNGKIWLFYVSNLIVRKIYTEPGYILTFELDYMTKKGRNNLENEINQFFDNQTEKSKKRTEIMSNLIDDYYLRMKDRNDLYPSTDTSIDPENEEAIKILKPKLAEKINQWRTNNPQISLQPCQYSKLLFSSEKSAGKRKNKNNKDKIINYETINIAKKKLVQNLKTKRFQKDILLTQRMLEEKYEPCDIKTFYPPNRKVPKCLIPPDYIRNFQNVNMNKFTGNFIMPNEYYRPKTANKSTQKKEKAKFAPVDEHYVTLDGKVEEVRNFCFTTLERKNTQNNINAYSTQTCSSKKLRPKTSKHRSSWCQLLIDKNVKL